MRKEKKSTLLRFISNVSNFYRSLKCVLLSVVEVTVDETLYCNSSKKNLKQYSIIILQEFYNIKLMIVIITHEPIKILT